MVTDASGNIVEKSDYRPYGEERNYTGPPALATSYRYTDQELDTSTGLYNYDARHYDPAIGRFISPDSLIPNLYDPQQLNPYAYCRNNPLRYTDPTGHAMEGDSDSFFGDSASDIGSLSSLWGGSEPFSGPMYADSRAIACDMPFKHAVKAGTKATRGPLGWFTAIVEAIMSGLFGYDTWDSSKAPVTTRDINKLNERIKNECAANQDKGKEAASQVTPEQVGSGGSPQTDPDDEDKQQAGPEQATDKQTEANPSTEGVPTTPPEGTVPNPHGRPGSYGVIDETGKFKETWRYDKARPEIKRGHGSIDHIHLNGEKSWHPVGKK